MNRTVWIGGMGWIRSLTVILGCVGAVALLTWVSGYTTAALGQRRALALEMTEPYDAWLSSARAGSATKKGFGMQELVPGSPFALIPPAAIEAVEKLPWVEHIDRLAVFRMRLRYEGFKGAAEAKVPPLSVGVSCEDGRETLYRKEISEGRWLNESANPPEVVVSPEVFTSRDLPVPQLGEMVELSSFAGVSDVKVVGFLRARKSVSGFPTMFVPTDVLYGLMPDLVEGGCNLLLCKTGRRACALDLREAIIATVGERTPVRAQDRERLVAELSGDLLRNMTRQAPLMLILAFLTAVCLTGTAVRIGVTARVETFGLCRVIGMTGAQASRLIRQETIRLLAVAWIIGWVIGLVLLYCFIRYHSEAFPDGIPLETWLLSALFSSGGLALAGHIAVRKPCYQLRTLEPLNALNHREVFEPVVTKGSIWISLLMMSGVLILLWVRCPAWLVSALIVTVGLPIHIWGLWRLVPRIVHWADRLASQWISPLLTGASGRSNLRMRALVLTIGIGLGSYCAVQIWGASMMEPFLPSVAFPDVVASFEPNGLLDAEVKRFSSLKGVKDPVTLNARQFVLSEATLQHIEAKAGARPLQNNVLLMGLSSLPKRFSSIVGKIKPGECIIPLMFARQGGFTKGDEITVRRVLSNGQEVTRTWRIGGVLNLNWHLVTARAGMRGLDGAPFGTLGPVMVREEEWRAFAPRRFGSGEIGYLWFDLERTARFEDVERLFTETVSQLPQREAIGLGKNRLMVAPKVTLHRRDEISEGTLAHGAELIGALAAIPFWSLLLLLLGVSAVTQANIDSRRQEFATLRTIGLTQRQLRKLLLSEVTLQLTIGTVVSLIFGLCIGWLFTAWTRAWLPFGGLPIVLRVPWHLILKGVVATYLVGILYACIPIFYLTSSRRRS